MAPIRSTRRARPAAGFTLIELMITVAIIGVLASIAYPAYGDYMRRAALPQAFSAMQDYRIKMEQYFLDYKNYGTNNNGGSCANGTNAPSWNNFQAKAAPDFTITCATVLTGTTPGYLLTATGAKGRAIGHVYTLSGGGTADNTQATTKFKGATVSKSCWLVRGNEC